MKKLGMMILLVALAAGCQTAPTSRYGDVDDDVSGDPSKMEYTQKSLLVTEMMENMQSSPAFKRSYPEAVRRAKTNGHDLPTVIVGKIEDNTEEGSNDYLSTSQMRQELITALSNSDLFEVIDLNQRARTRKTVVADVDGGAQGANLQAINEYWSGDFTMTGEVARDQVSNSYFHFFNLRLENTATGTTAWSGTVRMRKDRH